jgi:hypothetical protein
VHYLRKNKFFFLRTFTLPATSFKFSEISNCSHEVGSQIPLSVWDPKISFPLVQYPTTGASLEPDEPNTHSPVLGFGKQFNILSHLRQDLSRWFSSSGFSTKFFIQ